MKGLVKLVLVLAVAYALVKAAGHVDWRQWMPGGDPLHIAVLSVKCVTNDGLPRAEVEIRNKGDAVIESPRGIVRFGKAQQTGYFTPTTIPPNTHATMTVYPTGGSPGDCDLLSIEDRDGRTAELARQMRTANPHDKMVVF